MNHPQDLQTRPILENDECPSILVVDDTRANLRLLVGILVEHHYKVRPASNGRLALSTAQAEPPDLILLDIQMPEMDGYEVCRVLKADERTRDIPVIFISALSETVDKVKGFALGGVDYVTKPFQVEEVLARVETHLKLSQLQKRLARQNEQLKAEVADRQRAETALQQANDALERRVEARTADLVRLNAAYERFIPRELASFLQKESIVDVQLGDQIQREMSILFSDIRDFTALSEMMSPQENFNFINAYLSYIGPVIRHHCGFIDKYIGDAVMALFPEQAGDALQAAIGMLDEVANYNTYRRQRGRRPIRTGIGLHTGELMLGIIGEEQRLEGTVISDAVNTAARIEGLTKQYGASILVSEKTLFSLATPTHYHFRFLDKVKVKGKIEPISVFEILDGLSDEDLQLKLETRPHFEKGLLHYHSQEFEAAKHYFAHVVETHPDDRAAVIYLRRVEHFIAHGVPPGWEGIEVVGNQ